MDKTVILIIDKDPNRRKTLADRLEIAGYDLLTAQGEAEGRILLQESAVNLVLIGLDFSGSPERNVLSLIKNDYPDTEVIVLIEETDSESALEASRCGAFSYLVKPFQIDQLLLQTRRAIEKQQADEALRKAEVKFNGLLESGPDGILIINDENIILAVNKQFEGMLGYNRAEIVGRELEKFIPHCRTHQQDRNIKHTKDPKIQYREFGEKCYALKNNGRQLPVEIFLSSHEALGEHLFYANIRDITERKQYEKQLQYQANHDNLTDLPNRNLLADRLVQALQYANRYKRQVAVLFIDLDRFKLINDSLGHNMGDRLLRIVAERLTACVRTNDTIARQGGDDFVIVLYDLARGEDAAKVAQKIHASVNQPIEIGTHKFEVTCSVGISIYPKDGNNAEALLKNADAAMFRAKEKGRNTFEFFTQDLNNLVVERITLERYLRKAIEENELSVHYQPQVDLGSGRIIGMEALLRWQSPELGSVSPTQFIPLAEETGLIIPIGEMVLKTACAQNKRCHNLGFPSMTMAVNLSPRQFWSPNLIKTISIILHDSGLEPRYLDLEITEGMFLQNMEGAMSMVHELKKLGVQLSMDDFGTGYSSLSQLKNLPFDKLKMDISFVQEVTHNPGSSAIAKTIITMAHNLNLRVIAEGIETEGQLCYLRKHGCDDMQGFYFSHALSSHDFEQLLQNGRRLSFPDEGIPRPEKTILVVDDEPDVITAMKRVLKKDEYSILSATDANYGFELLATNRVGVVLCDQRMPGMGGVEFLSKVSRLYPETVRIAMSGYADMAMITDVINQGAVYKFLAKPIKADILRQNVANAFKRYKLVSEQH